MTSVVFTPSGQTVSRLAELVKQTGRHNDDLLEEAVRRMHRIYVGEPPPDGPSLPTGGFHKQFSTRSAEVVLRQVDPTNFELREPFVFDDGGRTFTVPLMDVSDLASIPPVFTWLIPRYGRHTLAALLHDHLQDHRITRADPRPDDPERVTSAEADTYFRVAMQQSGVPFLRRWIMWAGVTLRTRVHANKVKAVMAITWAVAFAVIGIVLTPLLLVDAFKGWFGFGAAVGIGAGALALPFVVCGVWGKSWRFGVISAATLTIVAFPTVLVAMSAGSYLAFEWLLERSQRQKAAILVRNMKA